MPRTRLGRRLRVLRNAAAAKTLAVAADVATPAGQRTDTPGLPAGNYRIDMHAHFLPPAYREALLASGRITVGGYPVPEWSPEAATAFMDRYGIQAQVLSISDPGVSFLPTAEASDLALYCNEYAAALIRRQPDRFGALAVLPMPDASAAIDAVEHALGDLRLDGVVLLSSYDGTYLGDRAFDPLMRVLNAHGAYVFVHPAEVPPDDRPGLPLPRFLLEYPFDTTRAAASLLLGGTIKRYPDIRWQFAHAGGTVPFLAHRLGLGSQVYPDAAWPNGSRPSVLEVPELVRGLYYDTALSGSAAQVAATLAVAPPDHLVFGSDWPFSALTLQGSGDPQPELSDSLDVAGRLQVERSNALAQLPRLAAAVPGLDSEAGR